MLITFWAKRFGRNVSGEKIFFGTTFCIWGLGAGQGRAGLGWAGGWAGLAGWAGLGLGWGCWAAGGWDGLGGLVWVGRLGWAGLGCWAAGLGCVSNPETEIGLFENETEVGLFANGKLCLHRKKKLPDVIAGWGCDPLNRKFGPGPKEASLVLKFV